MKRFYVPALLASLILAASCGGSRSQEQDAEADSLVWDVPDTVEVDLEQQIFDETAEDEHLDQTFDDFLFVFTHTPSLQRRRVVNPLPHIDVNNNVTLLEAFDCAAEFEFLGEDCYTILYGNSEQIEALKQSQDSIVHVERIDLNRRQTRSYEFQQRRGAWTLVSFRDFNFDSMPYGDFLNFYAQFVADSVFQCQSIAQPLRLTLPDPDEDDAYIEGTIDADQWSSFAPELPQDVITNIVQGQHYGAHRMVMQKCGMGNGMQEIYTFDHIGPHWRLVSYEN